MNHLQLPGRLANSGERPGTRTIAIAGIALSIAIAMLLWRLVPDQERGVAAAVTTNPATTTAAESVVLSDDTELHLSHAEQQLIAASEQLATARRLLAALGPALTRNYLESERHRAERAWTACDSAQQAIEQAREHIVAIEHRTRSHP